MTLGTSQGFGLVELLITLAITGFALVGIQKILTLGFRGSAHTEIKTHVRYLSTSIANNLSCEKTFEGINLASACSTTNPLPILLKDRVGDPLTEPLIPGNFTPTDGTLNGAGKMGSWFVRAHCEGSNGNLVIRYAKVASESPATFYPDPFTKRVFNWENSVSNPLFGTPDRVACRGPRGFGGSHIETAPMELLPFTDPNRNCTPSFTKNGKLYLIAIGAVAYTLLMPDSHLIQATVRCPVGHIAVGGGAQCGLGVSIGGLISNIGGAGNAPGYLSMSQPVEDGSAWSSACCVEGIPNQTANAYAVCIPRP